jgi:hypothetical protein
VAPPCSEIARAGSTYFPAADSEKVEEDIALLLLLKLFDVLEGTHLDCSIDDAALAKSRLTGV